MADSDLYFDIPSEAQVHTPKDSLITRETPRTPRTPRHKSFDTEYEDLYLDGVIASAKFPVYMVHSHSQNKTFAMKAFPLLRETKQVHPFFLNEIRFVSFSHPNLIKTVHYEHNREFLCEQGSQSVSYTLMEYASHGELVTFTSKYSHCFNERLVRTYFRQLIEGLEYIHSKGAVHMDIKLDNLLLDSEFNLKIADFDFSAFIKDPRTLAKGTRFYRAPEIKASEYRADPSADVYSAGVVLFALKSKGVFPHGEDTLWKGRNLFEMLNNDNAEFWKFHSEKQKQNGVIYSRDFKELINGMLKLDPVERWTIKDIKASTWYNGLVYTKEEMKRHVETSMRYESFDE